MKGKLKIIGKLMGIASLFRFRLSDCGCCTYCGWMDSDYLLTGMENAAVSTRLHDLDLKKAKDNHANLLKTTDSDHIQDKSLP